MQAVELEEPRELNLATRLDAAKKSAIFLIFSQKPRRPGRGGEVREGVLPIPSRPPPFESRNLSISVSCIVWGVVSQRRNFPKLRRKRKEERNERALSTYICKPDTQTRADQKQLTLRRLGLGRVLTHCRRPPFLFSHQ
jgi:hypothetical protein